MLRTAALALPLLLAAAATAHAHPAPYPHKHTTQPEPDYDDGQPAPDYDDTQPAPDYDDYPDQQPPPQQQPPQPPPRQPVVERYPLPLFYIQAGPTGSVLLPPDSEDDLLANGGGLDLRVGWRLSPFATVDIGWTLGFHPRDDWRSALVNTIDLDVKLYPFPAPKRFMPYIRAGVGGYFVQYERVHGFDDSVDGIGLQAGLGFEIHLTPHVALTANATYRAAWIDNTDHIWDPYVSGFLSMLNFGAGVQFGW